jgi:hypothetical protein
VRLRAVRRRREVRVGEPLGDRRAAPVVRQVLGQRLRLRDAAARESQLRDIRN